MDLSLLYQLTSKSHSTKCEVSVFSTKPSCHYKMWFFLELERKVNEINFNVTICWVFDSQVKYFTWHLCLYGHNTPDGHDEH